MRLDLTVTLGNLLTILAMFLSAAAVAISWLKAQMKLEAKVSDLERGKVSVADCLRSHGEVVTKDFCTVQHRQTGQAIEKLTEEFGTVALTTRELLTNQRWLMAGFVQMNEHGVKTANPTPAELPPLPPGWDEPEPLLKPKHAWEAPEE
jgi:hypothetical protein